MDNGTSTASDQHEQKARRYVGPFDHRMPPDRLHSSKFTPQLSTVLQKKSAGPDRDSDVSETREDPPTSYLQTITHIIKGNIGPGIFAMGDAFKNGGYVVAPLLVITIAVISVHCQHVLINCAEKMRVLLGEEKCGDYAQTVEQCFANGPQKLQSWSRAMKVTVNIFICVTQLGFCCVYFVFIGNNIDQILKAHDIDVPVQIIMLCAFVPLLLSCLITNLKWLTPVSLLANICMFTALGITLYFALVDGLPAFEERNAYTNSAKLSLFFGTAIFAFEGIALVLPLKNAMKKPSNFDKILGVLNVGMVIVTMMMVFTGFVGYMKWGEDVAGSLTLSLGDTALAQSVKGIVSFGVGFGYPLQFFIPIQIMWPRLMVMVKSENRPLLGELLFRTSLVILTFGIACIVPALSIFISLIGAVCATALALVFPPMIELLVSINFEKKGLSAYLFTKNIFILFLALVGFSLGTYQSLAEIVKFFQEKGSFF